MLTVSKKKRVGVDKIWEGFVDSLDDDAGVSLRTGLTVLATEPKELPKGWQVNGDTVVREISISEYDFGEIPDDQMRADANAGFDLRQRAEANWEDEVVPRKLTKIRLAEIRLEQILWAINHAHSQGEHDLAVQMSSDKAGAVAYYDENHEA
ncbi:hypothetical protein LCGC14_1239870 [marine sediment metagenome]|uniref:Uncharacterized protein n=1 Tax=marine sediment metagenome TaxID=412755 RepID=A0A0F9L6A9_9ZZZZ